MNPNHVQLPTWMFRLVHRTDAAPATTLPASRIEVRPPEVWQASTGWRGTLRRWLNTQLHRLPEPARPVNRLALVKDEFLGQLGDMNHPQASLLAERIGRARSLRELWHLRSAMYNLLARTHSQHEAEERLAQLNRHFPTRATRTPPQALGA